MYVGLLFVWDEDCWSEFFSYALPTLTFYVMIQSLFSRIGDLQYFLEIIVDEFVSDSDYLYVRAIELGGELVSQELQSGE